MLVEVWNATGLSVPRICKHTPCWVARALRVPVRGDFPSILKAEVGLRSGKLCLDLFFLKYLWADTCFGCVLLSLGSYSHIKLITLKRSIVSA